MEELGNMYFRGEGVAKDDAKALAIPKEEKEHLVKFQEI
jgi:hypothetical protein